MRLCRFHLPICRELQSVKTAFFPRRASQISVPTLMGENEKSPGTADFPVSSPVQGNTIPLEKHLQVQKPTEN